MLLFSMKSVRFSCGSCSSVEIAEELGIAYNDGNVAMDAQTDDNVAMLSQLSRPQLLKHVPDIP